MSAAIKFQKRKEIERTDKEKDLMERRLVLVGATAALLGALSAASSFAAESQKLEASDVPPPLRERCVHPRSPAFALGLMSLSAALAAQAVLCAFPAQGLRGESLSSHPSSGYDPHWKAGLFLHLISWVAFLVTFAMLVVGVYLSDRRAEEDYQRELENAKHYRFHMRGCYVKQGFFSAAGVLSVTSVLSGLYGRLLLFS